MWGAQPCPLSRADSVPTGRWGVVREAQPCQAERRSLAPLWFWHVMDGAVAVVWLPLAHEPRLRGPAPSLP